MLQRIVAASKTSGIGLPLLPVAYQYGECDGRDLTAGQIRFGNNRDKSAPLVDGARLAVSLIPADCTIGTTPHSLHVVAPMTYNTLPSKPTEALSICTLPTKSLTSHGDAQLLVRARWQERLTTSVLMNVGASSTWPK